MPDLEAPNGIDPHQPVVQYIGHPHIGERIRALRERRGLTLRDLESLSGVGRSRLSQIESAAAPNPSLSTLLALQDAFQLDTIESLLGDLPSGSARRAYPRSEQETA